MPLPVVNSRLGGSQPDLRWSLSGKLSRRQDQDRHVQEAQLRAFGHAHAGFQVQVELVVRSGSSPALRSSSRGQLV